MAVDAFYPVDLHGHGCILPRGLVRCVQYLYCAV
jgi:hypothetical protein